MNVLFELIWNKNFVVYTSFSIVIFGVISLSYFYINLQHIKKHLNEVIKHLKQTKNELDFKNQYDELNSLFLNDPIISHSWYEFSEGLLISENKIKNTKPASNYFSRDTLFYGHLNLSFYQAMPNILTGLGILGTFIGLLGGISQVNVQNIESIEVLLNGASFAFSTSIAGLLTSIIFTIVQKRLLFQTDSQIQSWVECLDKRLEWISPEKLAYISHNNQKKQIEIFENMADQFGLSVAKSMKDVMDEQLKALEGIAKDVSKQPWEKILVLFNENNQQVNQGFEEVHQNFLNFQGHVVENSSKALIEALESVISDFNVKINEQFGDNFKRLNEAVGKLLTWQENYREFIDKIHQFLPHYFENVKESTELLKHSSGTISLMAEKTTDIAKNLSQLSITSEDIETHVTLIKKENAQLEEFLKSITVMGNQAKTVLPSISQHIERSTTELSIVVEKIKSDLEYVGESLKESVLAVGDKMQKMGLEHSKHVDKTTEQIETNLETVLNEALTQFAGMLVALSKQFVDDYGPLTKKLSEVVRIADNMNVTRSEKN